MFGSFVGAPVIGYLADKYGRKPMVVFGHIAYLVLALVSAWLPYLSIILVARFLLGFLHIIICFTVYVHMIEVLEPKIRTWVSSVVLNVWAVGTMFYGGYGYIIRDWRILQTVATLPGLLILPTMWLIDESPRWLIVNGRRKEALQVLGKVARWHGVDLPPEEEMKTMVQEQAAEGQDMLQHSSMWILLKSAVSETLVLFRTPRLRTITLCVYFDYLMSGMVYYGLSLSGATISDDPFVYIILMGLMEVPANSLVGFMLERFGRKSILSVGLLITAVVLLSLGFIPTVYTSTVIALAMIGKVTITGCFQTIIFFSNELFPTEVRSRGVCTACMMSRLGNIACPFITDLVGSVYPWAPFVIFGSGALLAGAGTLLLPETRGQTLPDTVAQLEEKVTETPKQSNELQRVLKVECD